MKAVIERIEDGKTAAVTIIGGGQMIIPKKQFKFKIHEGMWLDMEFSPDEKSEAASKDEVIKLQQELLSRSKKK